MKNKNKHDKEPANRPARKTKLSVINKFVVFSLTLFLVILAAGSTAFIFSMRQIIRANKGQELSQLLEIERIKLEASVNSEIAILLKLSDSPLIKEYFLDPGDPELEKTAMEEFASYRRAFAGFSIFWINDIDRLFHSDNNDVYWVDADSPENYWYPMTLYETETYNFNINYNPDINTTRLWVNAPVFDEDHRPIGMVGTSFALSSFVDRIFRSIDRRAELYLFNAGGEITGADDVDLISVKKHIDDELPDIGISVLSQAKALKAGETKTFDAPSAKVAIGTIPALNWYSIAIMPDSFDDYKNAMTVLFLVVLALISLIFVIFNVFIARFLRSLRKTVESLRTASKAKSDFLAKMSHEIRTPMNAIIGMTELALHENLPPAAYEHILTIKQSGANLLSIINDILDFSKIESGKLEILPADYLFSSLANDVISIIRMRVIHSQVKFVVNIDSNIPNALYGDEIRIRQALLNILNNAIKYTENGYVSFSVSGRITNDETVLLTITVEDSGRGIKQEDIGKLFGDFVQIDSGSNRGIEGTGLGLAITQSILTAMNGRISVQSEYGKGSTFTITLPQKFRSRDKIASIKNPSEGSVLIYERREIYAGSLVDTVDNLGVRHALVSTPLEFYKSISANPWSFVFVESVLAESVSQALGELKSNARVVLLTEFGEPVSGHNLTVLAMPAHSISVANILNGTAGSFHYSTGNETGARFIAPDAEILVVDDVKTNLKVAEGLLLPYQVQVDSCLSGLEALALLQTKRYDLILLDHMMPVMDGVETARRIRALEGEYYQTLPIVALTANAVAGAMDMLLQNGFNDFLSKPVDTVKLNLVLEKWIPKNKQKKTAEHAAGAEIYSDIEIELEGVDVQKGIVMTGGTPERYLQTLSLFYKDGLEKLKEIKAALAANDMRSYITYVHAIKSASANIGASNVSEIAKVLEAAGRQKDWMFIQINNARLMVALEALVLGIRDVLDTASRSTQPQPVDTALLKASLAQLKAGIERMDLGAISAATDSLTPFASAPEIGSTVEKVLENTLIGEYDEVLLIIDTLHLP